MRKLFKHKAPQPAPASKPAAAPVELRLGYNEADQLVCLAFGTDISSITFTPVQAETLAAGLVEYARAARGKKAS